MCLTCTLIMWYLFQVRFCGMKSTCTLQTQYRRKFQYRSSCTPLSCPMWSRFTQLLSLAEPLLKKCLLSATFPTLTTPSKLCTLRVMLSPCASMIARCSLWSKSKQRSMALEATSPLNSTKISSTVLTLQFTLLRCTLGSPCTSLPRSPSLCPRASRW